MATLPRAWIDEARIDGVNVYLFDSIAQDLSTGFQTPFFNVKARHQGGIQVENGVSRHITGPRRIERHGRVRDESATQSQNWQRLLDGNAPSTMGWIFGSAAAGSYAFWKELSPSCTMQLMTVYISKVDRFARIMHKLSLLNRFSAFRDNVHSEEAGGEDTGNKDRGDFEVQLSVMFNLAVLSLTDAECLETAGHQRSVLLEKLRIDVERGLSLLDLTTTHDLGNLQTFLLHIAYLMWTDSTLHASSLLGLAVRVAQRMGLHRDGAGECLIDDLSSWQIEFRRRIWHFLVLLDTWCLENQSLDSAIPPGFADTLLPQNIDDSKWNVSDANSPHPAPQSGFTDMSLALVQYETAALLRTAHTYGSCYSLRHIEGIKFRIPLRRRTWAAIQHTYLQKLDANDPEQAFVLEFAKFTIERIRFTQSMPLAWSNCCDDVPCGLKHGIVTSVIDICDSARRLHNRYGSWRLDWAISCIFAWDVVSSEVPMLLERRHAHYSYCWLNKNSVPVDGEDVFEPTPAQKEAKSTLLEDKRVRELVDDVLRERLATDMLHNDNEFWQLVDRLRAELRLRQHIDDKLRRLRLRHIQQLEQQGLPVLGIRGCGGEPDHNPELWDIFYVL